MDCAVRGDRKPADCFSDDEEPRSHRRIHLRRGVARIPPRSGDRHHAAGAGRRRRKEEDHPAVIIRDLLAPNPGAFTLSGTRTYLLGETAVIDPGPDIESHIKAIRTAMPKLLTILITHRHGDHAPAAVPLKRLTGARILAPHGVLDDNSVDQRISDGERIAVEDETLEVIATPGHTSERVCFLTTSGDLFTGDTVLGEGTTAIFPP